MQFNEKLKSLRAEKGISQAELAKQIFVSRSAVAKWENGLGLPSDESLKQLSEYFGVSVSDLQTDVVRDEVIIQKNNTLSKQKIVIIALSVLLVVMAILSAALIPWGIKQANNNNTAYFPGFGTDYTKGRGLIFWSTEYVPIYTLSQYRDEELSTSKYFPASRIFVLPTGESSIRLPDISLEVTSGKHGMGELGTIDYDDINFYCMEGLSATFDKNDNRVHVQLTDPQVPEYVGCLNIKYGLEIMSIKIVKDPIPVETVKVTPDNEDGKIGVGLADYLYVDVYPYNATYRDYSLQIDKIERPDGSFYIGDLSKYAHIGMYHNQETLFTEKEIEVGSKVYVTATATHDNVTSEPLIIEIKRIPVTAFHFNTVNKPYSYSSHIDAGDSYSLQLSASPDAATANMCGEDFTVSLLTEGIATLEYADGLYTLTASDKFSHVDGIIRVQVSSSDGFFQIFEWTIAAIPVESITIINAETDEELASTIYLHRGDTLQLSAVVTPENATIDGSARFLFASRLSSNYASLSEDGLLTINDDAPLNVQIYIHAIAGRELSKLHTIVVQPRPVETITISCDFTEVERGKIYEIDYSYTPNNANITQFQLRLVANIDGIYVSGNRFYVADSVPSGTKFGIAYYVNGVYSNILEFTVI